ncbi:serine protease [Streptomyces sp. NPDC097595]|uniref:S1 family peptidase n=1 Tax=Streptomyces sp. NPDC097595 TaxID=3366090 RepID=UPI00382F4508
MGELRADWRLRLRRDDPKEPVCGAGVLITQDRVLTCAHVVGAPDTRMWVEFAENPGIPPVAARVAPDGWFQGREDIAVLALESPRPQAEPAPLSRRLERGAEVWLGGYAAPFDADGMWLAGRISGLHGTWVQLDARTNAEVVRPGFSGAAVHTGHEGERPESVVGLVVSWRGDLEMGLPMENDLAFSYMIPVDRIAELVPLVAELSGPDGWDHALTARLRRWFAGADQPSVRFSVIPEGGGRDRTLRHQLHRAHLVHQGGRGTPDALVDTLVAQLRPPLHQRNRYRDWLLEGGDEPERSLAGRPAAGPVLAVIGLDEEPDPAALVRVLARVRALGFRLLIVVRGTEGPAPGAVERDLLVPALDERAEELLRRAEQMERTWSRLDGLTDSASAPPRPATAPAARRHRLGELRGLREPHARLVGLKQLLRDLRADVAGAPGRLPGQRPGPVGRP